jgi:FkbM family methyltransferase
VRFFTREQVEQTGVYNIKVEEDENGKRGWNLNSFWIYVDPEDHGYSHHALTDGYWEAWITLWMSNNVTEGSKVLDIGANHGYYSLYLASLGCEVIAIEPQEKLCNLLEKSAEVNKLDIDVRQWVVGDRKKKYSLEIPVHHGMNATIQSENSYAPFGTETVEVQGVSLNEFSNQTIDFIKIDAEGAEALIWAGGKTFRKKNPHCVYLMEWRWDRFTDPAGFAAELLDTHVVTHVDYDGKEYALTSVEAFKAREHEDWMLVLRAKNE